MRAALPLVLALLLPLAAGCLTLPETPDEGPGRVAPPPVDRIDGMTAQESAVDTIEPCEGGGIQIPPGTVCARRVLTVTGRTGVPTLPVDLSTVNGAVSITAGPGDAWSFIADVRVRALTEDAARRGLDTAWSWSHEEGGKHHLKAAPTAPSPATLEALGATLEGASYEIVLPAWAVLDVKAVSTNGAMAVTGFRLDGLELETTNGALVVEAETPSATLATSNGAIEAALTPTASGAYRMSTDNGKIGLLVPETRERGYDATARTTNGAIEFLLRDGTARDTGAPGSNSATFETNGYSARSIQTTIALETTNGAIVVAPSR